MSAPLVPAVVPTVVPPPAAPSSAIVDVPVCLRLRGRRVLVVGAGVIGAARAADLVDAGADVVVVAPAVDARLAPLIAAGRLAWHARAFVAADVEGAVVVFAAVNDRAVAEDVAAAARARGVLVNVADVVDLCDFTLPSVGRRGPISVAVSTSGAAPALARALRQTFEAQLGHRHVALARLVAVLRARLPGGPRRMQLLRDVVDGAVGAHVLAGERRQAFAALRTALAEFGAAP